MIGRRFIAPAALALSLWSVRASAQPLRFDIEVTPSTGTSDDQFTVTVTAELLGLTGADHFTAPAVDDFTVVSTRSDNALSIHYDASNTQQVKSTDKRVYVLEPRRNGRLFVGPAKLRISGIEYETRRVSVDVSDAGGIQAAPIPVPGQVSFGGVEVPGYRPPAVSGRPDAFLSVMVDDVTPFQGQQLTATWLLFTAEEVLTFEPRPPRLDDLWSEKLYEPSALLYDSEVIDGRRYDVAVVGKSALFPTRAGRIQVQPFRADISTPYTGLGTTKALESPAIDLQVAPLPPGAPKGFDPSYVGRFSVRTMIDRTELQAGESLTLTLQVEATGAIRRTTPPQLEAGGFQFRAPRDFDETVDTAGALVRGSRTYRYWTTPERGGDQTLPSLKIPYFDPDTAAYLIAESQPISLVVHGDPKSLGTIGVGGQPNFIPPDIRLIRDGTTISSVTLSRAHRAWWYWALIALPIFGFVGVAVGDAMRRRMQRDTPRARLRRARGKARKRFRLADIHLRGNRPSKFFAELARVLYEHVEERVGQPVQSLTRDELAQLMASKGFDEGTIERIDEELQNCDFARFTPAASGPAEMKEALGRTQQLLKEIERTPGIDEEDREVVR